MKGAIKRVDEYEKEEEEEEEEEEGEECDEKVIGHSKECQSKERNFKKKKDRN